MVDGKWKIYIFMVQALLAIAPKLLLGRGIDKKFPFLVSLYKKVFNLVVKEGEIKVNIPLGLKIFVSNKDSGLGMFLRTKGEFEPIQTKYFLESVKKGFTVFDIGANIGYYTILASKKIGNTGRVYAFEPDPRNLKLLKLNIALNNCKNVVVVEQALSKTNGSSVFMQDSANPGESRITQDQRSKIKDQRLRTNNILVRTITLDSFVVKNSIKKIDLMKMDIEGGEINALMGGTKVFRALKNVKLVFECNKEALKNFSSSPLDLIRIVEKLGLKMRFILNEFEGRKVNYSDKTLDSILEKVSYVGVVGEKE